MAYNRKNYLKKIIKVQDIVLKYQKKSLTNKMIYWTYIYPEFSICMRTFSTYLGIPAKRDLKAIEELEAKEKQT